MTALGDWIRRRLGVIPKKPAPTEFRVAMLAIERKVLEMELSPQGLDTVFAALKLFEDKLELSLRFEGDPAQTLVVGKAGPTLEHNITYSDGIYEDLWRSGPDWDVTKYATLELLVWSVAGPTIPRLYEQAYDWAKRRGKLGRSSKNNEMLVPINALDEPRAREFEKIADVWRRKTLPEAALKRIAS